MEAKYKNGKLIGYEISDLVSIHGHLLDPDSWFITIRKLSIFGERLCEKSCSEPEMARYAFLKVSIISDTAKQIELEINKFT